MNSITRCIALIAAGSLFSLGGCDSRDDSSAARGTPTTQADNTGSNWDDVGRDAKTPMDQSQASEHVKMTADIRQAIISDDTLPIGAKNCKIITDESGRVWLRGVVNSQAEKDLIESKARHFAGTNNVTNELEVKESSLFVLMVMKDRAPSIADGFIPDQSTPNVPCSDCCIEHIQNGASQ